MPPLPHVLRCWCRDLPRPLPLSAASSGSASANRAVAAGQVLLRVLWRRLRGMRQDEGWSHSPARGHHGAAMAPAGGEAMGTGRWAPGTARARAAARPRWPPAPGAPGDQAAARTAHYFSSRGCCGAIPSTFTFPWAGGQPRDPHPAQPAACTRGGESLAPARGRGVRPSPRQKTSSEQGKSKPPPDPSPARGAAACPEGRDVRGWHGSCWAPPPARGQPQAAPSAGLCPNAPLLGVKRRAAGFGSGKTDFGCCWCRASADGGFVCAARAVAPEGGCCEPPGASGPRSALFWMRP